MENTEYEDLDALVRSAGWARLLFHVEQQWGTEENGGGHRFMTAVREAAKEDDANATARLRQIVAAPREIHLVMRWAQQRLDAVKPNVPREAALSRRGGL